MNKLIIAVVVLILIIGGAWAALKRNNKNTNTGNTYSASQNAPSKTSTTKSPQPTGANEVSIINMNFSPASLTVKKGLAIKWINNDSVAHTVTENDNKNGPSSPPLQPGATYSFTFNETGVFHYHCSIHPSMTGVVTVTE